MRFKDIISKDEIILYHGSRGGLKGTIHPASRERCDFGKGFYMGSNPEQAKGLVVEDSAPKIYTLKVNTTGLSEENVLFLDGLDWVYTILAYREKSADFNKLPLAKECKEKCESFDFIVGCIADDRMNEAMRRFIDNGLTDKGLLACLESIDYGFQIVAKTQDACNRIEVLSERDIFGKEADDIKNYVIEKRLESRNIVSEMARRHIRDGLYLTELIEKSGS